jgi:Ca-activated chloride channel family protein
MDTAMNSDSDSNADASAGADGALGAAAAGDPAGPSSRHRAGSRPHRAMPRSAVLIALLLGGGIVIGSVLALHGGSTSGDATCSDGITLTVAAAPGLATPLTAAADTFRKENIRVDGRCVRVTVTSRATEAVAAGLTAGQAGADAGTRPDVWIPESASWLDLVHATAAGAALVPATGPVLASTPVVIAMPAPMASALGSPAHQLSWRDLYDNEDSPTFWAERGHPEWGGFRMALADPASSSAGLNTLVSMVAAAAGRQPSDLTADDLTTGITIKQSVVKIDRRSMRVSDPESLLSGLRAADTGRAPLSYLSAVGIQESNVIAYNRGHSGGAGTASPPKVRLTAVYPPGGQTVLEQVPYVVLNAAAADSARATAAARFLDVLRSDTGTRLLADAGFRTPAGVGAGFGPDLGVLAALPAQTDRPTGGPVLAAARANFRNVHESSTTLFVLDSSDAMRQIVPNSYGKTAMNLELAATFGVLSVFPDSSDLGLWQFSTDLDEGRDYQELIPIGPLSEKINGMTRRDYAWTFGDVRPGGGSGLYNTALAAFEKVTAEYTPGQDNRVIILAGAANTDTGGISLDDLVSRLKAQYDPKRPISLVTIAYGAGADQAALRRISDATHARSYSSPDRNGLFQVLLDVLSGR